MTRLILSFTKHRLFDCQIAKNTLTD
jgi:hypothetical protein